MAGGEGNDGLVGSREWWGVASAAAAATQRWLTFWTCEHPSISGFAWRSLSTPASSWPFLVAAVSAYLGSTLVLRFALVSRKLPLPLGPIPVLHNLVLCVSSAAMFVGCWKAAFFEMEASRWLWGSPSRAWQLLFCFPLGTAPIGRIFFWSYMYYLSKYYEFVDTLVLLLRRRPLTFLHVFHHAGVVVMSFSWLQYSQSLQVIALLVNTAVHVLMYSYYFLCSLGIQPPWKKVVTNCQIVQFVFSFAVSLVMLWLHFAGDGCAGFGAWIFNAFFNGSLLLLFVNFHRRQYKGSAQRKARTKRD